MNGSEKRMVKEMIMIILGYGLLLQIVLIFLAKRRLYASSGLWIGIVLAVFMLVYMYQILIRAFDREEKSVGNYVLVHSIIRYVAVVVIYGIVIFTRVGSPFACFAGLLSLKAAAYLQPFCGKLKRKKKE